MEDDDSRPRRCEALEKPDRLRSGPPPLTGRCLGFSVDMDAGNAPFPNEIESMREVAWKAKDPLAQVGCEICGETPAGQSVVGRGAPVRSSSRPSPDRRHRLR